MLISIVFPLFVLSFILIQGSVFWLILLQRLSIPQFGIKYTGKIYRILKLFDVILLCIGLFLIIQNYSNIFVMTVSFFIWAFAVVEWVNYYKVRLSYSLDPFVLLEYIKNGKLKQSRIAKEIKNR